MDKVFLMLFYSTLLVHLTLIILVLVTLSFSFSPMACLKLDLLTLLTSSLHRFIAGDVFVPPKE
ncbi:hypothetical protein Goshw_005876 [Gossypium schwendimanii]|uniref:Uncharacterized protein n=1 Tax=Gossypium schwendimanii TaxID=34291 RepID=A0A7J9KQK1_GOSSC|nr:hypothetical protein [Gossypium schwendimanii]